MKKFKSDVAIIGGGPAGLTAAIYAVRAGLSVTVYDGNGLGGQMLLAHEIENYAGFTKISGIELADAMAAQAQGLGASFTYSPVTAVAPTKGGFSVSTDAETDIHRALILATGTRRRKLSIPGEDEFIGRGVSYCAVCDGRFFSGKDVVVVGGGNTAVGDALYLSKICNCVTLVHRRDSFRADRILIERLNACENVKTVMKARVEKIMGSLRVESVEIIRHGENALPSPMVLPTDGVFVAVGSVPVLPSLEAFDNLARDAGGYLVTDDRCRTSVPGLYVAGDVRAKALRQIATASADGAIAAVEVAEYLSSLTTEDGVSV